MNLSALLLVAAAAAVSYALWTHFMAGARARHIDRFVFPDAVSRRVRERYPHLSDADLQLVIRGLREYFHICRLAKRRMVSMPSQVVDVAWHEFILFTRGYRVFCGRALGRFLDHVPSEAMRSPTVAQDGIRRAWRLSCARAGIDPKTPHRLPLLFAIDTQLGIADGFPYALDCATADRRDGRVYCASHIGCGGGCGGASGCVGDTGGGGGSGGSDGGGCGGGGD